MEYEYIVWNPQVNSIVYTLIDQLLKYTYTPYPRLVVYIIEFTGRLQSILYLLFNIYI